MDLVTYALLNKKKANLVNGKVPAEELPSYVDDIIEVNSYADLPEEGESGKIYYVLDTQRNYRWSGSSYVEVFAKMQYIKELNNYNLLFNDIENNQLEGAKYSAIFGSNNSLGINGFKIISIDNSIDDFTTLTLREPVAPENFYSQGDTLSYVFSDQKIEAFTILSTALQQDGQIIAVKVTKTNSLNLRSPDTDDRNYIYCIEKPTLGEPFQRNEGNLIAGTGNKVTGNNNFVAGRDNVVFEDYASVTGRENFAVYMAHAEGSSTSAKGQYSHTEGAFTKTNGLYAHAEGHYSEANATKSHAEGDTTKADGASSHAEGSGTHTYELAAHSEGSGTQAKGKYSHAEGYQSIAEGQASHAEGQQTNAIGKNSHAEGISTEASGEQAHVEGHLSIASGNMSHSEGDSNTASGFAAHSEGSNNTASGSRAHAEGYGNSATAQAAHAEGQNCEASGADSHAEGYHCRATKDAAHAEGYQTTASGYYSHSSGIGTIASGNAATVIGKYNEVKNKPFIIGNGDSDAQRTNIFEVGWDGKIAGPGFETQMAAKQDTLTPGPGITIDSSNKISANLGFAKLGEITVPSDYFQLITVKPDDWDAYWIHYYEKVNNEYVRFIDNPIYGPENIPVFEAQSVYELMEGSLKVSFNITEDIHELAVLANCNALPSGSSSIYFYLQKGSTTSPDFVINGGISTDPVITYCGISTKGIILEYEGCKMSATKNTPSKQVSVYNLPTFKGTVLNISRYNTGYYIPQGSVIQIYGR